MTTAASTMSIVFVFGGEGTTDVTTDLTLVKSSRVWKECMRVLSSLSDSTAPEELIKTALESHSAPRSPMALTIINLCLCELWRAWGFEPTVATGHSIGELCACYASGMYTLEQTLRVAQELSTAAATVDGAMLHTVVDQSTLKTLRGNKQDISLAAVNSKKSSKYNVTLCGKEASVQDWLSKDSSAVRMKPKHPWHSKSAYSEAAAGLFKKTGEIKSASARADCAFHSATMAKPMSTVDSGHWKSWLTSPVEFEATLSGIKSCSSKGIVSIEVSPHPALSETIQTALGSSSHASSMCRGVGSVAWAMRQRRELAAQMPNDCLKEQLSKLTVDGRSLGWETGLAEAGFKSQQYPLIAAKLEQYFPGVQAHDLYRFPSLKDLCAKYDGPNSSSGTVVVQTTVINKNNEVLGVAGVGVALGGTSDMYTALGDTTKGQPVRLDMAAIRKEAAPMFKSAAQAEAASDAHTLGVVLTSRACEDACDSLEALKKSPALKDDAAKERFGVYVGCWMDSTSAASSTVSAYGAIGESTGSIAGVLSSLLDARGPSVCYNTACSSALVALDAALGDVRRGRIDFAIVGGLNLTRDQDRLESQLAKGRFLSPTRQCHTFSSNADGYARAEGGAFFLVGRTDKLFTKTRALVVGTAVTQNRSQQPISAVDGEAQARCMLLACADASIDPSKVDLVECHGTGTPLGDPVEVAALSRVYSKPCALMATKQRFGHAEAAAGALGLLAATLACERRSVPRRATDGKVSEAVQKANTAQLDIPAVAGVLAFSKEQELHVAVSSMGFAGSCAHVILKAPAFGYVEKKQKAAVVVAAAAPVVVAAPPVVQVKTTKSSLILRSVWAAMVRVGAESGCEDKEQGGDDVDIFDVGVDSLGLAEMIGDLESNFKCQISIDDVFADPTPRAIAKMIAEGSSTGGAPVVVAPPKAAVAPSLKPKAAPVLKKVEPTTVLLSSDEDEVPRASSVVWFATTHVGSLPRDSGAELDVATIVQRQRANGVDVVNDGEWSRPNYVAELIDRIEGIGGGGGVEDLTLDCSCEMPMAADMVEVPLHAAKFSGSNGLISLNPKRPARAKVACVAAPRFVGEASNAALDAFLTICDRQKVNREQTFWSVPSPGTIALFCEDKFYAPQNPQYLAGVFDAAAHKAYVFALAEAMRGEYEVVASSGATLQVDCPDLAMGRHTRWSELDLATFVRDVVEVNVDALNFALRNIPEDKVRFHVCWGNYQGPHHRDVECAKIWTAVQRVKARVVLLETANARHEADLEGLELGEGKILAAGVIDTKSPTVEHPELVARRLLKFAAQLGGAWKVMASTDCGFASTARSAAVTADVAWLKIGALNEGAKLARHKLANLNAPLPSPTELKPVGFRVLLLEGSSDLEDALRSAAWPWTVESSSSAKDDVVVSCLQDAVDWPVAIVACTAKAALAAEKAKAQMAGARRKMTIFNLSAAAASSESSRDVAMRVRSEMVADQRFDKLRLALPERSLPNEVDVVVIGGGLCGMVAALEAKSKGFSVCLVEKRTVVGGVWSSFANSSSQVNSSEGGYNLRSLLPKAYKEKGGGAGANRDHSPSSEVLEDISSFAESLASQGIIHCGVEVSQVISTSKEDYAVVMLHKGRTVVTKCRGVVVACNDRVGKPRAVNYSGSVEFEAAGGKLSRGLCDDLAGYDWRGKEVCVVGFGAFAVENVRTALEHGASKVTVIARRHGTVCPKMIDYLNFVKPFDENFAHDTASNVKQMRCWQDLYKKSGATVPECWPGTLKHQGHTVSVSDIWWVAHHLGKLETRGGLEISQMEAGGARLDDGSFLKCDCVVSCIGFERNTVLCSQMTGRDTVCETNYVEKNLMYLADAEIDENAFNSFLGSSVLEYAKFFSKVFAWGLSAPDQQVVGEALWGSEVARHPISDRKWSHHISAASRLIKDFPEVGVMARTQVDNRTVHFYESLPPSAYLASNKREWVELHTRLNGGVPMPVEDQLPYFFDKAPEWCSKAPLKVPASASE